MTRRAPAVVSVAVALLLAGCGPASPAALSSAPERSPNATSAVSAKARGSVADAGAAERITVILGRPTASSIALSVMSPTDVVVTLAYGPSGDSRSSRMTGIALSAGQPRELKVQNLAPNSRYAYEVMSSEGEKLSSGTFHTQRLAGEPFTFTVTADSHLDQNTDVELYRRTLANALVDVPDFHVDLGDTFMTDKQADRSSAGGQYLAQREYLSALGRSAPLFLALGNHDGESGKLLRDGTESAAAWSNAMRERYFPNPVPDDFYSGNTAKGPSGQMLQDYFAWTWGDALFVVLDPYWNSAAKPSDDVWGLTLGETQYAWLRRTLETSNARYKFVFLHQLVGGFDKQGRGGAEAASFGEWGGKNADGSDGFAQHRPGWSVPIHTLLVANGVSAVFHGHDHLYAAQALDGIVYQEVPQPGFPARGRGDVPAFAAEYGYREGTILGSSGHLRVSVSPGSASISYVRVDSGAKNGQVATSYTITPKDP